MITLFLKCLYYVEVIALLLQYLCLDECLKLCWVDFFNNDMNIV